MGELDNETMEQAKARFRAHTMAPGNPPSGERSRDDLHVASPSDRSAKRTDMREEELSGNRARSPNWGFILQIVVVVGSMVGLWITTQTRMERLDAAATSLAASSTEIKGQMSGIQSSVGQLATSTARLEEAYRNNQQRQTEFDSRLQVIDARIAASEAKIAGLQALRGLR